MRVQLTDAATGDPLTDLARSHQVWMHLIATRADLGTFARVHPEPTGRPGELAVELVFPTPGDYRSTPSSGAVARWGTCTTPPP
ncbi:hypothetical protein [Modestobacter sp. URMC 112]